ncbi:hypothetical protein [Streptomyces sp. BA2]|uniref:hypothetical protein n=1 Tax=Streptomyces sp. BA2 TaxID=436595 RepID=UPI001F326510|nr:hypothetical protein [Streptomyces sp. BA2]
MATAVLVAGALFAPAAPAAAAADKGRGGESDTMLYAGLAIALCALGALAVAAARSRSGYRRD